MGFVLMKCHLVCARPWGGSVGGLQSLISFGSLLRCLVSSNTFLNNSVCQAPRILRVVYGCVGVHGLALMAGTPSLGAGAPGARQGEGAGAAAGGDPGPGRGVLVETEDGGSNGG